MLHHLASESSFVENYLFSVWEELCVPWEIFLLDPSSWNESGTHQSRDQQIVEVGDSGPHSEEYDREICAYYVAEDVDDAQNVFDDGFTT